MTHKAYLVVSLKPNGTPFPNVCNVDIYSSPANGLTSAGGIVYADVLFAEGVSYGDAHVNLLALIEKHSLFAWVRPWVDQSENAHRAKYFWQVMPHGR
jgi:hypothetical protein